MKLLNIQSKKVLKLNEYGFILKLSKKVLTIKVKRFPKVQG
jgi:hypothetical protein